SYIRNAASFLASPGKSKVNVMGEAINSEYDESGPLTDATGSRLYFNYAGPKSMGGLQPEALGEDIRSHVFMPDMYISRRINKLYDQALALDSINTVAPDALCGISADGRNLYSYFDAGDGHGDIYVSEFNGVFYSIPFAARGEVNGYYREGA